MDRSHYRTSKRRDLTERQREVLALLAAGKTNREIGDALGITLDGAKFHVSEVMAKLGVSTREEAAEWWRGSRSIAGRVQSVLAFVPIKWSLAAGGAAASVAAGVATMMSLSGSPEAPGVLPEEAPGLVAGVRSPEGLRLVSGGWTWAHLPSEAAKPSQLIVLGRVTAISPGRPSTAATPLSSVYRVATFSIEEVLKAPAGFEESEVAVYVPGGTYGGISVEVSDAGPELTLGDRSILFLNPSEGKFAEPGTWVSYLDVKIFPGEITTRAGEPIPVQEALEAVRAAAKP